MNNKAIAEKLQQLSVNEKAAEKVAKEEMKLQKAITKEEARAEREHGKKMSSKITIKRIDRNKRKFVTVVSGLEVFGKHLHHTFYRPTL
ncbi:Translation machinery-associated protein 22 [Zancudomyces culisetae]|uniref:Translation machinery-associated protein 22 n=1 Tax=Zancudomyces culisetae TaxID=1213189 RepID=A0A1R1PU32_ZANCU|nr:Translation machinery-associated protein 22 [Zancudomyces culisetae]|eukprot:OMH84457.1 Translation machinery-associated protein 22 [Zancudomyces culisetae]